MSANIDQFMWRWQRSFAVTIRVAAEGLFTAIGVDDKPAAYLVGIGRPNEQVRHAASVEPENGDWPQSLFAGIPADVAARARDHPMQHMIYTDAPTMEDKPENIRRLTVQEAVQDALASRDTEQSVRSFVSAARPVEGHYVAVVLEVPAATLAAYPTVPFRWRGEEAEDNLLLAAIAVLLDEARQLLERPEPGRFSQDGMRSAAEMARLAAHRFFRTPFIKNELAYSDLLREFDGISRLMYEGARNQGRLALVEADDPRLEHVLKLSEPTPLSEARWARKLLETSGDDTVIASGYRQMHGLARLRGGTSDVCFVDFVDQEHWEFRRGRDVLVRVRFGEPTIPKPVISADRFRENYTRLFPEAGPAAADHCHAMLDVLLALQHGSMLVVAEDAEEEAVRLSGQPHSHPAGLGALGRGAPDRAARPRGCRRSLRRAGE